MNNYVLYLNPNGDGFHCKVHEHGLSESQIQVIRRQLGKNSHLTTHFMGLCKENEDFFLEFTFSQRKQTWFDSPKKGIIKYKVAATDVPECIQEALSCATRKETSNFIHCYLLASKVETEKYKYLIPNPDKYLIPNSDATLTKVALYHSHFGEREAELQHDSVRGVAHRESPKSMLQFIDKRSAFFKTNYKQGQAYKKMDWLDPAWFLTFLNYYLIAFQNCLSHIGIGGYLGLEPTHFCEDFDQGCKSIENKYQSKMAFK